jgi:cytoskeletal protein CcmA (bactofilin family)
MRLNMQRKSLFGLGSAALAAILCSSPALAQEPFLGSAKDFAVLGASTVTDAGASSVIGGLGVSPGTAITGFPAGTVMHAGDAVALQAQTDVTKAYNTLAGAASTAIMTGQDLGGRTLTAGVYRFAVSAPLNGVLTLDAQGNANATFVFQIGSTLLAAQGSSVRLINGAHFQNVYWQVGSSATIGANAALAGNIVALASITLSAGTRISGRAFARTGAVTMDHSSVSTLPTSADANPAATTCLDVATLVAGGTSGSICSSAAFTSGANSTVNGWVTSQAATTLGANGRVHGNVTAGAAYTSGDSSVVDGNVSASGDITLGANSRVLGTVHSGTGVITYGAGATVGGVI